MTVTALSGRAYTPTEDTTSAPAARAAHPRSAVATRNQRRQGACLTPVDPSTAPTTYSPGGHPQTGAAQKARGLTLYVGLDELTAAAHGTNLTEIAQALQELVLNLAPEANTRAVIALESKAGGRTNLDAVQATMNGGAAKAGASNLRQGPVRSRIPGRLQAPSLREQSPAALRIDIPRREVHIDGELSNITTKEFDLLATLVSHAGETLSRQDLIEVVWAGETPDERTVDVHVRRLRNRLKSYGSVVRTIRGSGYRFDEHPDVEVWQATAVR